MDIQNMLDTLKESSLFDLFRVSHAINHELDDPKRIEQVRWQLTPGMKVQFLDWRNNRMVEATIKQLNRTHVQVVRASDGAIWTVHFGAIDLSGNAERVKISDNQQKLQKADISVGDSIGFHDKQNRRHFGIVERLNQKTASIITRNEHRWRVTYSLLFRVITVDEEPGKENGASSDSSNYGTEQ